MDLTRGDTRLIISACLSHGLLRNQAAYVLATVWHETANKMKPITELGGQKYLKAKKYWPYIGRGYVQLTWKANYADWSKRLGVDLVDHPELALDAGHAVRILVEGMKLGTFTGKKLSDYITLAKSDFVNARRIINGMDRAKDIAGYAKQYDALLKADGYGEIASPAPVESPKPVPAAPVEPPKPQPAPAPAPVASKKPVGIFAGLVVLAGGIAAWWHHAFDWLAAHWPF